MASRTVVTLICDIPHPNVTRATEALSFSFDGRAYDIDLCAEHGKELRSQIAGLAERARRIASPRQGRADTRTYTSRSAARQRNALIREWAREHGRPISDRGRISISLVQDYEAAAH